MRCRYCGKLIIHRFNGNYTRMDKKRKARHERRCEETEIPRTLYCDECEKETFHQPSSDGWDCEVCERKPQ